MKRFPAKQKNNTNFDEDEDSTSDVPSGYSYHLYLPQRFKPGVSGNPSGRPKGSISLKTYVKNKIQTMSEEEKEEFISGLPKEFLWKMAEGNPDSKNTLSGPNDTPLFSDEHKTKARSAIKGYLDRRNSGEGK